MYLHYNNIVYDDDDGDDDVIPSSSSSHYNGNNDNNSDNSNFSRIIVSSINYTLDCQDDRSRVCLSEAVLIKYLKVHVPFLYNSY